MCPHIELLVDISQSLDSESSPQCIENECVGRAPQGPMIDRPANGDWYGKRVLALHDYAKRAVRTTVVEEAVELLALGRFLIRQIDFVYH